MTDLIPESIKDDVTTIYGELIGKILDTKADGILTTIIDNAPPALLPYLARESSITNDEGWHLADTDTLKRSLIKDSVPIHRKKGTVKGIKDALKALNIDCTVKKWFDYGGKAGHIKMLTDFTNRSIDDKTAEYIYTLINGTKRQSAIVDAVEINQKSSGDIRFTGFTLCDVTVFIPAKEAL